MEASIHYTNLERKGLYVVKKENRIYKGIYFPQRRRTFVFPHIILTHVTIMKNGEKYKMPYALFDKEDIFYDGLTYINKIKDNARKATQQMEARALDRILKGIVNEEFQWM
jgi:hypothetical protein